MSGESVSGPLVPPKEQIEQLPVNTFIPGTISEIAYDAAFEFKGKFPRTGPAVQITITLDGYKRPRSTYWMSFNYDEKSNLFKQFLLHLVEGIKPYADFDVMKLKGMRVKTLWQDNPKSDWQTLTLISPLEKMLVYKEADTKDFLRPIGNPPAPSISQQAVATDIRVKLTTLAEGDTAEAEEHLKVISCYLDNAGDEHYLTFKSLEGASEKWINKIHKKVLDAFDKRNKKPVN